MGINVGPAGIFDVYYRLLWGHQDRAEARTWGVDAQIYFETVRTAPSFVMPVPYDGVLRLFGMPLIIDPALPHSTIELRAANGEVIERTRINVF